MIKTFSHQFLLEAYDEIEGDNTTAFLILGGSSNYRKQAKDLQLKNVYFLDTTSDVKSYP